MYNSLEQLCKDSASLDLPIWKVIQDEDCKESGIDPETSYNKMKELYIAMKESDLSY